jgi:hypothetical protein
MAVWPIVELELLYTARSAAARDELVELLGTAFASVPMPDRVFARATEVQAALTRRGQHRSAGILGHAGRRRVDVLIHCLLHHVLSPHGAPPIPVAAARELVAPGRPPGPAARRS